MSHILSIAKKELRAYFLSPVAIIFFVACNGVLFFRFFNGDASFFARGVADIRPLFNDLPLLLIPLCAALTMRLWSEEQKLGTLEVLLTLPVKTHELVIGKFLGALTLVGVALLLTIGLPITAGMLGDLDPGPVFAGYLGALLLGAAYVSIGVCISAITENQVVALIMTMFVCLCLYMVGSDFALSLAENNTREVLAAIGTGSRFESIRRGVLDLSDLAYYLGLAATFLAINTLLLKQKGWSDSQNAAPLRRGWALTVALIAANAVIFNVVLVSSTFFRVDVTRDRAYSISPVTKNLLRSLDEPVLIRGYFSKKTHPLLAPTIPQVRDMMEEFNTIAGGHVVTEYVDPRTDAALEKEANQLYGIKSFPFRISDRGDEAVVNSYFSILVKYGDQYEVLNFSDLIEVKVTGVADVKPEVKLRNFEYDLTRTIKKVAFGFQTLDAVFAKLGEPAEFYAYITPKTLPENFKEAPARVKKVLDEMAVESKGKFKFQIIDPDEPGQQENREFLQKRYGFKPFATSLFAQDTFFLHLVLKIGSRYERLPATENLSEADLKKDVVASLKRATPGFLRTVGLVKPPKKDEPELPPQFQQQKPPPDPEVTQMIEKTLGEGYTVENVDLKGGRVPGHIDVLLVVRPESYDDKQRYAIDQHLMRGGTVIVLTSKFELDTHQGQGVHIRKLTSGLEEMLASYGVSLGDSMVLDMQNEGIPMPVEREIQPGFKVREYSMLRYPWFVDVRPEGMADGNAIVSSLPAVTMPWTSPVTLNIPEAKGDDDAKREGSVLLSSSKNAWLSSDTNVQPDFAKYGEVGFPAPPSDRKSYPLAVVVKGSFDSFYKGKKSPLEGGEAGTTVERSADNTRLIVVASTAFANDLVLNLTRQGQSNIQFVQNMVDYGLEDVELLSIRSRSAFARTLRQVEPKRKLLYEVSNYMLALFAIGASVVYTVSRRRRLQPVELEPSSPALQPRMDKGVEAGS